MNNFEMYENGTNGTWPNGTNLYDTHVVSGLYQVPVGIIVLLSILYGTITLLAIVGNGLVIIVIISSRRMHSVTNYFIANLAVADILIGLFGIPFRFQAALLRRWNLPSFMCYMSPFAVELSVNVSIFSLAAIALDRYRAIMHPLKVRVSTHRAKMLIILIWILAVAVSIPYVVTYRVMLYENINTGVSKYFCYNAIIPQNIWRIYTNLVVGIQYIVPLIILGFAYTRMALRLWGTNVPGNAESERDAMIIRNKRKVIKMLFTVLVLFSLCWIPYQTFNIVKALHPPIARYKYINIIWFCCHWLAMSNSAYNPFIYGIYNEKFRREFKLRFGCCLRSRINFCRTNYTETHPQNTLEMTVKSEKCNEGRSVCNSQSMFDSYS